jgi:serine O-acetyltransferase
VASIGRPSSAVAAKLEAWLWAVRGWLVGPLVLAFRRSGNRALISEDLRRWREVRYYEERRDIPTDTDEDKLRYFLLATREFRNVFYYRLERGGVESYLASKLARRIWRPVDSLNVSCDDVGPGLVVRHGYSTILTAERIGANCFVHHEVTIGWDDEGARAPVLGDNVYVGTGAKILGAITIGSDVRIGANAVVLDDVPDGCTVAGVPARIVRAPQPRRLAAQGDGDAGIG